MYVTGDAGSLAKEALETSSVKQAPEGFPRCSRAWVAVKAVKEFK